MRLLIRVLPICLLFISIIPTTSQGGFYDPKLEVMTVKTEHFYFHYPKEVAPVVQDLISIAERVHDRLTSKLEWQPWGRTHVVVVDKTDSANGLATVIPSNYLLLYVTPPDADSALDHYKNYLELLFTHEYTHILHIDQHHRVASPARWIFGKLISPNGLTPGWMREGMATWEETIETGRGRGYSSYSEMIIRTAILENKFPAIDQIAGLSLRAPGSEGQYIYGVKFFQWLAEKYGDDRIQKYMEEYASGLWIFSLNNKARRVFGTSFYQLWKQWKQELTEKYTELRDDEEGRLTVFEPHIVDKHDQMEAYTTGPDGRYAHRRYGIDDSARIVIHLPGQSEPIELKRSAQGQMSFSRDGRYLAFSSQSGVERFSSYSEVFIYDTEKKKLNRAYDKLKGKKSLRASDPDFSPLDGGNRWIVMVRTSLGTDNLYVYDSKKKLGYYLTNAPKYTQFSNPRFSPDGGRIVVSRRDHEGNRDLILYSNTGQELAAVTRDEAVDNQPIWSPDGRAVLFVSDRNGIPNIYRHDVAGRGSTRITNVLTGVFQPQLSSDGDELFVKYYTFQKTEIHKLPLQTLRRDYAMQELGDEGLVVTSIPDPVTSLQSITSPMIVEETVVEEAPFTEVFADALAVAATKVLGGSDKSRKKDGVDKVKSNKPEEPPTQYELSLQDNREPIKETAEIPGAKKYSAFPQVLVPRYIIPTFATLDDSFLLGFSTGRFDPLYRHSWVINGNYRSDAKFVGASGSYAYVRYNPSLFVGFARYALNWGDLFGTGDDFYEQRLQGYMGASLNIKRHNIAASYFFEDRDNLSAIPGAFILPNLDNYAGLRVNYIYSKTTQFANSISAEKGPYIKIGLDYTDSVLGSAQVNEQRVVMGDFRYYFEMPWSDHHVFGIRTAGGWVWGDQEFAGSFRFGGPFGEGNLAGYSSRLFPFRGLPGVTFASDRVLLFSGEYRFPIAHIDRGIGTWPVFMRKVHMALFSDYGDSWLRNGKDNRNFFEDFFLSVGAELKSDFVIGYGMPVTARLGYAIVVLNRDQVAGLTDSLFKMDARNGTAYFQFGTSF